MKFSISLTPLSLFRFLCLLLLPLSLYLQSLCSFLHVRLYLPVMFWNCYIVSAVEKCVNNSLNNQAKHSLCNSCSHEIKSLKYPINAGSVDGGNLSYRAIVFSWWGESCPCHEKTMVIASGYNTFYKSDMLVAPSSYTRRYKL